MSDKHFKPVNEESRSENKKLEYAANYIYAKRDFRAHDIEKKFKSEDDIVDVNWIF